MNQRPVVWLAGTCSTGRLSRAGLISTGVNVAHSSHQCRWELSRRFLAPQRSQTNTSFLTWTVDTRVLAVCQADSLPTIARPAPSPGADSICRKHVTYYNASLMPYKNITPPTGDKISISQGKLTVPDRPVIPFIRGDGTGPDIWAASVRVFDAAIEKAFGGTKKVAWFEVFAGQAAKDKFDEWLPEDTVEAFREYLVGIKGPLTTPVGGGIRSLNVALRQLLDLFVCLRPVQYFEGVPSPVKHPEKVNMVIFRENTEDIYAGIEYAAGTPEAQKIL